MNGYHAQEQINLLTEAVKLLTEKVEQQGKEIETLKAKPAQIVRYEKGYGRLN
jgi:hypothetical protein